MREGSTWTAESQREKDVEDVTKCWTVPLTYKVHVLVFVPSRVSSTLRCLELSCRIAELVKFPEDPESNPEELHHQPECNLNNINNFIHSSFKAAGGQTNAVSSTFYLHYWLLYIHGFTSQTAAVKCDLFCWWASDTQHVMNINTYSNIHSKQREVGRWRQPVVSAWMSSRWL